MSTHVFHITPVTSHKASMLTSPHGNHKVYNLFPLPAIWQRGTNVHSAPLCHQLPQYPHPAKRYCCSHSSALIDNFYFFLFAGWGYCGIFSPKRRNPSILQRLVSWRRNTKKNTPVRTSHFISNHVTRLLLQHTNKLCARQFCKSSLAVRLSWHTKQTAFL